MVPGNLDTTNLLLGIMAAVSILEALLLIAVGVMAWKLYSQAMRTIRELEQRQVAPLVARMNTLASRVDEILTDVKAVSGRVTHQTERVDSAIRSTMDRMDETADRVRTSVSSRINRVIGVMHGVRTAFETFFNGQHRRQATTHNDESVTGGTGHGG
jgi:hypothetical protein